jgi:hypothetical protein
MKTITDTGFLVAFGNREDYRHEPRPNFPNGVQPLNFLGQPNEERPSKHQP